MAYIEKNGRLIDPLSGADRGPAKARLDPNGTEKGETRIVHHPPGGACFGPGMPLHRPEHEDREGKRTSLSASEREVLQKRTNNRFAAQFEKQRQEIEKAKEDASIYALSRLAREISLYSLQSERLKYHDAEVNKIYLSALKRALKGAESAFEIDRIDTSDFSG